MLTQREQMANRIARSPGECDDCLAEALGFTARQRANQLGRELEAARRIHRLDAECVSCGKTKTVSYPHRPRAVARPGDPARTPVRRTVLVDSYVVLEQARQQELATLAALLRQREALDREIARLIGRPAERGHIGEFVAARVFGIVLHDRANGRGHDGVFATGPLAGRSVNVKFYGKADGLLDVSAADPPQIYLVLTGADAVPGRSNGEPRPLVVAQVFLFEHATLVAAGVRPGTAASVRRALWEAARVWPRLAGRGLLTVDAAQARLLEAFGPDGYGPWARSARVE